MTFFGSIMAIVEQILSEITPVWMVSMLAKNFLEVEILREVRGFGSRIGSVAHQVKMLSDSERLLSAHAKTLGSNLQQVNGVDT